MRRWKWLFPLLALLLLPGCAGMESGPAAAPPLAEAPGVQQGAAPQEGLSAAQTAAQARPLTEEEILSAYDRAVTAYGWFELSPLLAGNVTEEKNDVLYRRVEYPGITDMGELRSYLRTIFSQEVTDRLLATGGEQPLYTEIDGALYVGVGGRGRDPSIGRVEVRVQQDSDTHYSVNVSAEVLDTDLVTVVGMEFGSFPYEVCEDRWVFTDFQLPY